MAALKGRIMSDKTMTKHKSKMESGGYLENNKNKTRNRRDVPAGFSEMGSLQRKSLDGYRLVRK